MGTAPTPSERLARALADPWLLLVSGVGGGLAWAVGIPAVGAGAIGLGMLGGAAAVAAALRGLGDGGGDEKEKPVELARGTAQAGLVDALQGYLADLAALRSSTLPDSVTDSAIEALVATDGAHAQALRVAAAVDKLDQALYRGQAVAAGPSGSGEGVRASIDRMQARRQALLRKLDSAVGEVAEVYTKLLELSATVDTIDVAGPDVTEVDAVNASLDGLRAAFAELEQDAARPA
jgi:hypothetical protein